MNDVDSSLQIDAEPHAQVEPAHRSGLKAILYWASLPLISLVLVLTLRTFLVEPYRIPSESMLPTLEIGDRVVVNRLSYSGGEIERGQVVVFEKPPLMDGENDVIKRVVALPGETIRFVDDEVIVDEFLVVEPYIADPSSTVARSAIPGCADTTLLPGTCVIPEGHVFVLGDNRRESIDSRVFGPIPIETIIGRAFWQVWPLDRLAQI